MILKIPMTITIHNTTTHPTRGPWPIKFLRSSTHAHRLLDLHPMAHARPSLSFSLSHIQVDPLPSPTSRRSLSSTSVHCMSTPDTAKHRLTVAPSPHRCLLYNPQALLVCSHQNHLEFPSKPERTNSSSSALLPALASVFVDCREPLDSPSSVGSNKFHLLKSFPYNHMSVGLWLC